MTTHLSFRVTDEELAYLRKVAYENELFKSGTTPSESKGIKHILKQAIINEKNKNDTSSSEELSHITKLIEQINVLVPHLIHNSKISATCLLGMIKDTETAERIYRNSLKDSAKICGQIQDEQYKEIYIASDKNNMRTIPIEEDKNKWK